MSHNATRQIHIKGVVQGVGFRPFVYTVAKELNVKGWVRNSSAGVDIVASGTLSNLDNLLNKLEFSPPPLAKIDHIQWSDITPQDFPDFTILPSKIIPGEFIPISPDIAICEDCQRELFDPQDHRYRYPFINCTNCGPRLTIIEDIPYDRPKTTMAHFPMCGICKEDYEDPLNRRFHAQPIACSDCGPKMWFQEPGGIKTFHEDGLQKARDFLRNGKIIAIKGLGGFHLACDATNPIAVENLRNRKKRSQKPFAVMGFNIASIVKYCDINEQEKKLILSKEKPIVIVNKRSESGLPDQLSPGRHTLGVMLPYTPLHLLLLEPSQDFPDLFVMTSGNISEEPITYENVEGLDRLDDIADGFLLHDRDIYLRVDDSVISNLDGLPYFFRRARGYAPQSIMFPDSETMNLAVGAELKNTFCLTKHQYAFVSHHIGDLKNFETYQAFTESIDHYARIFNIQPQRVACDLHPEYLSSKFAAEYAQQKNIPLVKIQHHHAHLAACLAENHYFNDEPVIGMIFDGTGYGTDGNIWGGEVLLGNIRDYQRVFHLKEMPLPGGDHAVLNPYRIAIAYLLKNNIAIDKNLAPIAATTKDEMALITKQIASNVNVPLTTSMGRLFDAVASLIGLRQSITYEAQAAIELEQSIQSKTDQSYVFQILDGQIGIKSLLEELISDILINTPVGILAEKFHNSVVDLVLILASKLYESHKINTVALSGGVWQNQYLLKKTIIKLKENGFNILYHRQVPANDGGISLGQAAIINSLKTTER